MLILDRRWPDLDELQRREEFFRQFFKVEKRKSGALAVECQEPRGNAAQRGGYARVLIRMLERSQLNLCAWKCEDEQDHESPEDKLEVRLPGQVGAGERNLVEIDQAELGEDPSEEGEQNEMARDLAPRPDVERQASRDQPDGGHRKERQQSPGLSDVFLRWSELSDAPYPVGCKRDGQRENAAKTEDRQAHHHVGRDEKADGERTKRRVR